MALVKIHVYGRENTGKNENRRTRASGRIPGVLYGPDRETRKVQLDTTEFTRIMQKTGGGAVIFDLDLEGEPENPIALLRELQQHPVSDEYLHVDLLEIPRGKPVEVEVPIVHEGEPEAVRFGDAAIVQLADTITVSCLPREVPEQITVDVSGLELNGSVYVKDLTTPAGEIVSDPETQILVLKTVSIFLEEDEAEEGEGVEGEEGEEGAEGGEDAEGDEDAGKKDD